MTRRDWRVQLDRLLPLGLSVLALAELLLIHDGYDRRVFVPLSVLLPLTLLWRRRLPLLVLAINIAAWVVIDVNSPINEDPLALAITLVIAVYSVGAHTRGRKVIPGALLVAVLSLTGTIADANEGTVADFLGNAVFFFTIFGGVWLAGRAIQSRRLRERQLIVERDEGARAAVAEERSRIARELHDVVAHAISVIVLQARGARHSDGAERDEALTAIETTGAAALTEMRRLLHMLRADDEAMALAPQPSLDQLEGLVTQVRDAGLPVELRIQGARRALPPGVDVSAYRIVQEALTNALKHAGPARARVSIRYEADALELEIADTGTGADAVNGAGSGHGLVGMRERVAVFGGELDSGPHSGGGFTVRARLPL
jgi:signal transduction histidine kinase